MKSPPAAYSFAASAQFWKSYAALSSAQKKSAREAWQLFSANPFHPLLRTHKIRSLSARYGCPVWSCVIEGDLRVVFTVTGAAVQTIDIGRHKIYR